MKNILVIGEASDKPQLALEKAISLAKLSNAKIHVVVNYYQDSTWKGNEEVSQAQFASDEENWWRDHIEADRGDLVITHQLLWEKYLVNWILDHCKGQQYDMIIKQGHRTESMTHTPTDWLLLRESPLPVYIVTPIRNRESNVILVSLDVMARSSEKQALNKQLLEEAFKLSVATNSTLHVCYIVKILPALTDMDIVDPEAVEAKVKPQAEAKIAELLKDYDVPSDHIHVLPGDPNKVISSLSNRIKANCIVIGSMGRKGIVGKFFGNTSEKVVRLAHKDLLVIGPK